MPAFERDDANFPVQYLGANVPQAWAAGSAFMLTQAMLGFLPDAPRDRLYVDPSLPKWLPDLALHDLRIGKHKLDIRFWREGEQTAFEVIKGRSQAGRALRYNVQDRAAKDGLRSNLAGLSLRANVSRRPLLSGHVIS